MAAVLTAPLSSNITYVRYVNIAIEQVKYGKYRTVEVSHMAYSIHF